MDAQTFLQETGKTLLANPFVFFCIVLLSTVITLKIKSRKLNVPPSPPKLPIIGNLHQISSLPHRTFTMLSKKYGPLMLLHFGRIPILVVSSLEIAKEIFESHDHAFADRPSMTGLSIVFNDCPDMGLGPYSDRRKEIKKQCVLQLLSQRRVQQLDFIRKEEVEKIVEKMRILSADGCAFNISELFMTLAQNILSRSAFGSLYGNENKKNFGQVSRRTMDLISAFCFKDTFPFLGWMDHVTGLIGNLKEVSKELQDFLDQVIEDHLALMNDDDDKVEDKKYLVDILLCSRNEGLSMQNLKAILMDMIIGGIDSVATAMEWMMAELMKNPIIRKRAQEEVRRVVGKKSEITQTDIKEMKYLKCIIKENVRFHGSGLMPRQTSASVKLQGYEIPAKSRVLVNVWAIQRDPTLWDRPDEFVPERFLSSDGDGENDDISPKNEQVLFSFGGGKRKCPGMPYAYAEIEIIFANLLFWFDWELEDDLDMEEIHTFAIRKKHPVSVVAHPYFP
ncbi:cytochrome P450 family 71 subfamily B polypeptide 2 [Euphorbia peplus]|nr:cytochrome P450 family 71 subfamily B polypeptide 2 [Euphorbia peplus]